MLVLGLGGAILSFNYGDFSLSFSGMSLAAIIGILLNLALPNEKEDNTSNTITNTTNTTNSTSPTPTPSNSTTPSPSATPPQTNTIEKDEE